MLLLAKSSRDLITEELTNYKCFQLHINFKTLIDKPIWLFLLKLKKITEIQVISTLCMIWFNLYIGTKKSAPIYLEQVSLIVFSDDQVFPFK